MNIAQNRPSTRVLSFILEAAKLLGIAIGFLLVFGAAVIVFAKTGLVIPARWFGLFYWTCALLWFVFKQHKRDLRLGKFWLVLTVFLAVHVTAFIVMLRAYAAWRMAWFMFIFIVEGPLVLLALQNAVHPNRKRKHV